MGHTTAPYSEKKWNFNTIIWHPGIRPELIFPKVVPLTGHRPLWITNPLPGLILYADEKIEML